MAETVTTLIRFVIVREIREDRNGATLHFQQGGQGCLAPGDTNYETYLRLARRSQERQHPIGINFGERKAILEILRADNDVPTQLREQSPDRIHVFFQGHDGVYYLKADHPEFVRLCAILNEAVRQKAQVWFIAQKPDLVLLDVLPAGWTMISSHPYGGGDTKRAVEFVGGPLAGMRFDSTQINAVARVIPIFTESGSRQFLLMPPRDECERILRGELTKERVQGARHPYERVFTETGVIEYRVANDRDFETAIQTHEEPLDEEARARKQKFRELADKFIAQLRSTNLTGATEVAIVYQCVDQQGNTLPPIRTSITPRTTVRFPGDQNEARVFASARHLDSLIGNINSLVRNAPTGYVSFPEHPGVAVRICGFELEIEQPE